eukprot:TRINITY_DN18143_c0_g1_i1.p1 TRINITY_DN18143_c0_g1~~TRINITY_DN18143_c0_g1_i1.p1  ORF type:complete len:148 (-),score=33.33 TRINITY_DN18143_c0_g1_i1:74-517(-)
MCIRDSFYTLTPSKKHFSLLKDPIVFGSLSLEDKEELIKLFLRNESVLHKLREIVITQLGLSGKAKKFCLRKPVASSVMLTEKAHKNSSRTNETSVEYPSRGKRFPHPIQVKTANIVFQGKSLPRIITKERNDNLNLPFFQLKKYVC